MPTGSTLGGEYRKKGAVVDFYGMLGSPTQQMDTTAGALFGEYNAITGYYQNVRSFKNEEVKFKSITEGTARPRGQVV